MEPPAPSPETATASRRHLTSRYADGVDRLMWDLEKRLLPDADAVRAVIEAGAKAEALDIGAALVLVQATRLDLDRAEYDLFEAAEAMGMQHEAIAAVLDLPDSAAAGKRQRWLRARSELPHAEAGVSPAAHPPGTHGEAAARARRRAQQARSRAAEAAGRKRQLNRRARGMDSAAWRENAERTAGHASEARVLAGEAAESAMLGLLRAADAMDRCAAAYQQVAGARADDGQARRKAEEYYRTASRYRELASSYRDTGIPLP
jgi:hypothetical protein